MKIKDRRAAFICQITEASLKVAKYSLNGLSQRQFAAMESQALSVGATDKDISDALSRLLKKMGYNNAGVILSLPRSQAACRYLKVPSHIPQEIGRIANLQAGSYLPYPPEELVTAYEILQTDKEGYADINLIITHKDALMRYLNILKGLNIRNVKIVLSSFGLCGFYKFSAADEPSVVLLVDVDYNQIELAVTKQGRLIFSRSFKVNRGQSGWEGSVLDEIKKTQEALAKETPEYKPEKIIMLGSPQVFKNLSQLLGKAAGLPVETISYDKKLGLTDEILGRVIKAEDSFVSLLGLGLLDFPETLSLLPQDIKDENASATAYKNYARSGLWLLGAVILVVLAVARNFDNKERYLRELKNNLAKVSKEARPLEEMDKRLRSLKRGPEGKASVLDMLQELHMIMPDEIYLINITYDDSGQFILRGQSPELNTVLAFAAALDDSESFDRYNAKIRYASQKKTQDGEYVDFEIACLRK